MYNKDGKLTTIILHKVHVFRHCCASRVYIFSDLQNKSSRPLGKLQSPTNTKKGYITYAPLWLKIHPFHLKWSKHLRYTLVRNGICPHCWKTPFCVSFKVNKTKCLGQKTERWEERLEKCFGMSACVALDPLERVWTADFNVAKWNEWWCQDQVEIIFFVDVWQYHWSKYVSNAC